SDFSFFFSSRRRHTRSKRDWSSDVCSSDLRFLGGTAEQRRLRVLEFDEAQHSGAVADEHPEAALLRSAAKESLGRALARLAPERSEERRVGKECARRCGASARTRPAGVVRG